MTGRATVSRTTCFAGMDLSHNINSRGRKIIDICLVGSGVKYHSLPYWSIVMTSPVEFSTSEFLQTGMKSPLEWPNQTGIGLATRKVLQLICETQLMERDALNQQHVTQCYAIVLIKSRIILPAAGRSTG